MTREETLQAYAELFEILTPETLDRLDGLCSETVHFTDPFNNVIGLEPYKAVLEDMFEQLERATFEIHDVALTDSAGYLRWTFTMQSRKKGPLQLIPGMSEISIDENGRITRHLDHWDSGSHIYAQLPLIGPIIRYIQHKIAA